MHSILLKFSYNDSLINQSERDNLYWTPANLDRNSIYTELSDEILMVDRFLDPNICQRIRAEIDQRRRDEPTPKYPVTTKNDENFYNESKNNPKAVQTFKKALEDYLPVCYRDRNQETWKFHDLSSTYNWAMYDDEVGVHLDQREVNFVYNWDMEEEYGYCGISRTREGGAKFTCRIYLNDDYDGGEVIFYDPLQNQSEKNEIDDVITNIITEVPPENLTETIRIKPKAGSLVLFDVNLPHESTKIRGDQSKYWIGFDIIYTHVDPINTAKLHKMIEESAYFISENSGGMINPDEAWYQAEREIMFQLSSNAHQRLWFKSILTDIYDEYTTDLIIDHYLQKTELFEEEEKKEDHDDDDDLPYLEELD